MTPGEKERLIVMFVSQHQTDTGKPVSTSTILEFARERGILYNQARRILDKLIKNELLAKTARGKYEVTGHTRRVLIRKTQTAIDRELQLDPIVRKWGISADGAVRILNEIGVLNDSQGTVRGSGERAEGPKQPSRKTR